MTAQREHDLEVVKRAWVAYFPDFPLPAASQFFRWLAVHPAERLVYAFEVTARNRVWHGESFGVENAIRYISAVANRTQEREERLAA